MTRLFVLFFLMHCQIAQSARVAFIGDSLSTGGAAHPKMSLDRDQFRRLLLGEIKLDPDVNYFKTIEEHGFSFSKAPSPVRLGRSFREAVLVLTSFVA